MKSNKEIYEYLEPYLSEPGVYTKNLVVVSRRVRGRLCDHMCVFIDIKSSWYGYGGTNTRHQTIKNYLKNNGFRYCEENHLYYRPYFKKDMGTVDHQFDVDLREVFKTDWLR